MFIFNHKIKPKRKLRKTKPSVPQAPLYYSSSRNVRQNNQPINQISTFALSIGICFWALGIYIALSIISYDPRDYIILLSNLNNISAASSHDQIHNWFGAIGAWTAYYLVDILVGYLSIILSCILFALGWKYIRQNTSYDGLSFSVWALWDMVFLSMIFAAIHQKTGLINTLWSGSFGLYLASLSFYTMSYGVWILLVLGLILTILFQYRSLFNFFVNKIKIYN